MKRKAAATNVQEPGSAAPRAPRGARRAAQKLDKRQRIRVAAWELFKSQGYEATTTKQVASRAKVAAGTLFLYAKDKPDLLCMVFHERLRQVVDSRLSTLPRDAGLLSQLLYVFRGIFDNYADHPELARAFVAVLPGATGQNADLVRGTTVAFLQSLASLVKDAQQRGEVDSAVLPLQAASNIFALYFGALLQWLSGMTPLSGVLDPVLKRALELQLSGLLPRASD